MVSIFEVSSLDRELQCFIIALRCQGPCICASRDSFDVSAFGAGHDCQDVWQNCCICWFIIVDASAVAHACMPSMMLALHWHGYAWIGSVGPVLF